MDLVDEVDGVYAMLDRPVHVVHLVHKVHQGLHGKEGPMNLPRRLTMMVVALFAVAALAQDPAERYAKVVNRMVEAVKAGQVLGLCGNSGNSSEPHLHYHLQNTSVIQDGTGIKCFFDKVSLMRGGKTWLERRCSPVKGDIVEQQ